MEDFTKLWMRITWYVKGFPMRMFKWTPDFRPEKESPLTPVWIHFEGLPLYLFDEEPLLSIANSIGQPLKIDHNNIKRVKLGQASVCVAMDVSKPVRDKVWVAFEEEDSEVMLEGFWQSVRYEHYPSYCPECGHLGHSEADCKRRDDVKGEVVETENLISGPEKEKQDTGENKQNSKPPFRRVSRRREKQPDEKKKGTTKAWVQRVFGAQVPVQTDANPFQALEQTTDQPERQDHMTLQNVLTAQVPDPIVASKNPFQALEQTADQPEQQEQPPLPVKSNILDGSFLPPPSLLTGYTMLHIPVCNDPPQVGRPEVKVIHNLYTRVTDRWITT
ncbi:hypothetical protein LIER_44051 [Lithospermum erythrorhizon]|uniref:CCHC-type domain-containing protein n=1 Tax=Lithospermum erythrorhizon TaxID=34254 RepID=A0AAV3NSD1_LITER